MGLAKIRSRLSGPVFQTWRQYQTELREHGVTAQAEDLYSRLHVLLDLDHEEGDLADLEEELHALAFAR